MHELVFLSSNDFQIFLFIPHMRSEKSYMTVCKYLETYGFMSVIKIKYIIAILVGL